MSYCSFKPIVSRLRCFRSTTNVQEVKLQETIIAESKIAWVEQVVYSRNTCWHFILADWDFNMRQCFMYTNVTDWHNLVVLSKYATELPRETPYQISHYVVCKLTPGRNSGC